MKTAETARAQIAAEGRGLFIDSFAESPLFTGAAGAALIAGGCTTLTGAVILCGFVLVTLPLVGLTAFAERERIDERRRPAFYVLLTSLTVLLLSLLVDNIILPDSVTAVGIYAPLVALDGLVLHRTSADAPILLPRETFIEAMACALSFAVCALPIAFVRELLGGGQLFGQPVGIVGAPALQLPFFGFILCGLLCGLWRTLTGRRAAK